MEVSENIGDAPNASKASATLSTATDPSVQQTETTRRAMSTSSAAASADTAIKTGGTSAPTSKSDLRDASHDWALKSAGLKGTHQLAWPTSSSSFPTVLLTTGLDELGKAMFDDDHHTSHCNATR